MSAKERVYEELKELDDKIDKLQIFMESVAFIQLSDEMQRLLLLQLDIMGTYSRILQNRLDIW